MCVSEDFASHRTISTKRVLKSPELPSRRSPSSPIVTDNLDCLVENGSPLTSLWGLRGYARVNSFVSSPHLLRLTMLHHVTSRALNVNAVIPIHVRSARFQATSLMAEHSNSNSVGWIAKNGSTGSASSSLGYPAQQWMRRDGIVG